MVNKTQFMNELKKETQLSMEDCLTINCVLENNFIIGKKNKNKIIISLMEKLNINYEESENIYNISMKIILNSIKRKLRHPFGQSKKD